MLVQVLQRVIKADFAFPTDIPVSAECKDLISKILVVDPEKRLTVQQIQQHPWSVPCGYTWKCPVAMVPPTLQYPVPRLWLAQQAVCLLAFDC